MSTLAIMLVSALATSGAPVVDCLWRQMPEASRAALLAAYERGGPDSLAEVSVDDAEIERIHGACRRGRGAATTLQLQATGIALAGVALEHAAAQHITKVEGSDLNRFSKAWRALPSADRQLLREAYLAPSDATAPPLSETSRVLDEAVHLAGYRKGASRSKDDVRYRHYVNVFLGFAQAEAGASQL